MEMNNYQENQNEDSDKKNFEVNELQKEVASVKMKYEKTRHNKK